MKHRNNRRIIVYGLIVSIFLMSIAYAVLSTTLDISGTVVKKGNTWGIRFTDLSKPELKGNAKVANEILSNTTFAFDVSLKEPNDSITYTLAVENSGGIRGKLASFSFKGEEVAKQRNITYSLSYDNGASLKPGDLLEVKEKKKLKLVISYDDVDTVFSDDKTIPFEVRLNYVQAYDNEQGSSGTISDFNLALNGNLEYKDNSYFPQFTYENGELYYTNSGQGLLTSTHYIPIDTNKEYDLSLKIKTNDPEAIFYAGIMEYDVDKKLIVADNFMYIPNTLTTLKQDLKDGDTIVYLENIRNWDAKAPHGFQRGFIFWNYKDSTGYEYPELTYSRNVWSDLYDIGGINKANNTITLKSPWNHGTIKAGTKLSEPSSEGFHYSFLLNKHLTEEYQTFTFRITGVLNAGKVVPYTKFRPGTKYINLFVLSSLNSTFYIKDFVVKEV